MVAASSSSSSSSTAMSTSTKPKGGTYDREACDKLANLLSAMSDLPAACHDYPAAVQKVKAKEERLARGDAFSGMTAGAAVQARASKARGEQHFAQIQRRRTAGTKQFEKREKYVA